MEVENVDQGEPAEAHAQRFSCLQEQPFILYNSHILNRLSYNQSFSPFISKAINRNETQIPDKLAQDNSSGLYLQRSPVTGFNR